MRFLPASFVRVVVASCALAANAVQGALDLAKGRPPAVLDARVGVNLRLGADPVELLESQRGQAEPHVVRSALNPDLLLATFQEGRFFEGGGAVGCGYSVSHDGGLTWSRALIPQLTSVNGGRFPRASDPVAGIGPQGDLYLNTLALPGNSHNAILVSRSTDQGESWSAPVLVFESPNAQTMPDKNWMAVNDFAGTPNAGRLVVSWTNFRMTTGGSITGSDLTASFSENRGLTWSATVAITPVGANDHGSLPIFLPDGTLVVIYATFFGNTPTFGIRCKHSTDGGRTFPAQPTIVVNQIDEWQDPRLRHGPFLPAAAVARGTGEIFVTYVGLVAPAQPLVFVTRSSNRGLTWTPPVAVSDAPPGTSVMNPAIAVTPDGRTATVVFMDKRNATDGESFVDHYAAMSFDGGATWRPNIRLTEMSSDIRYGPPTLSGVMLGDYLGVAPSLAANQPFVAIWCDTRSGNSDPFVARLAPTAEPDFNAWRVARFNRSELDRPDSLAAADFDRDGADNLIEFDAGTDPRRPEEGEAIVLARAGTQSLTVATTVRAESGVYAVYGSASFGQGVSVSGATLGSSAPPPEVPAGAGLVWQVNRVDAAVGGASASRSLSLTANSASAPLATTRERPTSLTDSRLVNVSTRGRTGAGERQMIVGFVLDGNKSVLLRAAGPALNALGLVDTLGDPRLTLSASASDLSRTNDNWQQGDATAAVFARVGAFPFASNALDSALYVSLGRQNYSAVVSSPSNDSGIVLVEAYDADPVPGAPAGARFLNLSTRGDVGRGEHALIAGFAVAGTQPRRVLIRAVGPTLAAKGVSGALADPMLTLFRGPAQIATNDDWEISRSGAALAATAQRLGAFPLGAASLDAALLITLDPGNYTVVVGTADGGTGIALVEIYDAD